MVERRGDAPIVPRFTPRKVVGLYEALGSALRPATRRNNIVA